MSRERTAISSRKGVKIGAKTRKLYEERDRTLDPQPLPPEKWARAMRREEFFRIVPVKKALSVRLDLEVIDWLKSQGPGYLTRINGILRSRMEAEQGVAAPAAGPRQGGRNRKTAK